jgi:hypothetical protein
MSFSKASFLLECSLSASFNFPYEDKSSYLALSTKTASTTFAMLAKTPIYGIAEAAAKPP